MLQAIRRLLARPKCFRPEREWPGGYFTHGTRAPLQGTHNNYIENQIRPFAVGRAAWMFCDTQLGARASANLFSLVNTAKANGLEPLAYLTNLYTHLPSATTLEQIEALLPWNIKPQLQKSADPTAGEQVTKNAGMPLSIRQLAQRTVQ